MRERRVERVYIEAEEARIRGQGRMDSSRLVGPTCGTLDVGPLSFFVGSPANRVEYVGPTDFVFF